MTLGVQADPYSLAPLSLTYRVLSQSVQSAQQGGATVNISVSASGTVSFSGAFPPLLKSYAVEIEVSDNRTVCRRSGQPVDNSGCKSTSTVWFYPTWLEECSSNMTLASDGNVSARWRSPTVATRAPASAISWNNSHSLGAAIASGTCEMVTLQLGNSWPASSVSCSFQVRWHHPCRRFLCCARLHLLLLAVITTAKANNEPIMLSKPLTL